MHACIHTYYIHASMHTCIHTYIHTYIQLNTTCFIVNMFLSLQDHND